MRKDLSLTTRLGMLISSDDFKRKIDKNVTGATLVKLANRRNAKNRYFLYFSSHNGKYIRLAISDSVAGPYKVTRHKIARLYFRRSIIRYNHVASPEISRLGNKNYLVTHSPARGNSSQLSFIGRIYFGRFVLRSRRTSLPSYLRIFKYRDTQYGVTKAGQFFQMNEKLNQALLLNGDTALAMVPNHDDQTTAIRHPFVISINDELICFYTRIGDAPERIFAAKITGLVNGKPKFGSALEILRPEKGYEGAEIAVAPSDKGRAKQPVNELRDPFIFREDDATYLIYSVKGEQGIALATLDLDLLLEKLKD